MLITPICKKATSDLNNKTSLKISSYYIEPIGMGLLCIFFIRSIVPGLNNSTIYCNSSKFHRIN